MQALGAGGEKGEGKKKVGSKKAMKELGQIGQLGEVDRVLLLNNRCESEAELRLKVPSCENLSAKERKAVLELIKGL
jgi:hypothetical protein